MALRRAAGWASTVVSRKQVSPPGRVFRVFRIVSSEQQKASVARAFSEGRAASDSADKSPSRPTK
jgi:hypothetical protein